MNPLPFWIKERHNPQLGIYYIMVGQLSNTAARKHERPMYGVNYMHPFGTESEYQAELERLRATGARVQ